MGIPKLLFAQSLKMNRSITVAVLLTGFASCGLLLNYCGANSDDSSAYSLFRVVKGPLSISVTASGTIAARDQAVVVNEVEGRATIIYLIAEGTPVQKGDLLVELDSSELEDDLIDREISVLNAESEVTGAEENFEIVKNESEADVKKSELDYRFAQEDLEKYMHGDYPMQLDEAEARITIAKEEHEQAKERYNWSSQLFKEEYISQTEQEADRLSVERARLELELAMAEKNRLERFTYKRDKAQLESDVDQSNMAIGRVKSQANAEINQAEIELRTSQADLQRQRSKLAKIHDQISKCKIYAPTSGMVVYATSGQGSWRGNAEPLSEGRELREREELIYLPVSGSMKVDIKVHESNLKQVALGQSVLVTVSALPNREFYGTVAKIAPLPDAQSVWLNPDLKVYNTEVNLDGDSMGVHTGLTCKAEILIEYVEEALYVPVQAVIQINRQPVVYVLQDKVLEPRVVDLGPANSSVVQIIKGLEVGDYVSLLPPLKSATRYRGQLSSALDAIITGQDKMASGRVSVDPEGSSSVSRTADLMMP